MSILNQDLLTLDFWQDKVTYGKHIVPVGTGRTDASRLPARSVLKNALHFEISTGDPHPTGHLAHFPRKWYPNCKNAVCHHSSENIKGS